MFNESPFYGIMHFESTFFDSKEGFPALAIAKPSPREID